MGWITRNLPDVVALLLFGVLSTVIFLLVAGDVAIKGRMFFQAVLGTFLIFMIATLLGRLIFSPFDSQTRPFAMAESLVKALYRAFDISVGVLLSGLLVVNFVEQLGAAPQTVSWVIIVLGSAVLLIYGYLISVLRRQPVADGLLIQLRSRKPVRSRNNSPVTGMSWGSSICCWSGFSGSASI